MHKYKIIACQYKWLEPQVITTLENGPHQIKSIPDNGGFMFDMLSSRRVQPTVIPFHYISSSHSYYCLVYSYINLIILNKSKYIVQHVMKNCFQSLLYHTHRSVV